jgi:hypothetical protein
MAATHPDPDAGGADPPGIACHGPERNEGREKETEFDGVDLSRVGPLKLRGSGEPASEGYIPSRVDPISQIPLYKHGTIRVGPRISQMNPQTKHMAKLPTAP